MRSVSFTQFNGQEAEPARAGHPHLRSGRERRAGLRAGVHRRLDGFAHGVRDAAGEQRDRGDRHRECQVTTLLPLGYKDYSAAAADRRHLRMDDDLPFIGTTAAGQKLRLGGFSGLAFEGVTRDGKLKFITHTDRGPNGEPTGINRPFLLPHFNPRIVRFTLDPANGRFDLTAADRAARADGRPLTGLPNTALSADRQPALQR